MKRVAILISGGGSNMCRLVDDMAQDHPAEPVLVLASRPDAGGLAKAAERGVPTAVVHSKTHDDRTVFEAGLLDALDAVAPDILCLAGFMRILSAEFVARYAGRILNIHPSLLPKYKGLNTHARALAAGDGEAGCSVHIVTPELDDGPVLGQARVPVLPGDSAGSLASRVLEMEHRLYPAVLRRFATGDHRPIEMTWP